MNKKTIQLLLICLCILTLPLTLSAKIYAEDSKTEIWSYSLDERIEHRSIKVGDSNPNFGIMMTPTSLEKRNIVWSTGNSAIASVSGNNETATVTGLKEGSTALNLSVTTTGGNVLSDTSVISVYTPINNISGQVSAKATFYRGADSTSWVRSENVPVGQKITVIGSCGNYYYLELPDTYTFDDNRASRYTYALKSQIYIPITQITLNTSNTNIAEGKSATIGKTITPGIATNQTVSWTSNKTNFAPVDNKGVITGKKEGYAVITAKTNSGNKTAGCRVSVYKPRSKVNAKIKQSTALLLGADASEKKRSGTVSAGQKLTITGSCGSYYFVELPKEYLFGDGGSSRMAYVLKSKVYIPVESIKLNQKTIIMGDTATQKLVATVLPDIATNKKVIWSVNKNNIVSVDNNGTIKGINSGKAVINARTESDGKVATCDVNVIKNLNPAKLENFKLTLVKTNFENNVLKYTRCDGATEYTLYEGEKRIDGTMKWEDAYNCYGSYENGDTVWLFSTIGDTYYYKVVAEKVYARDAFDFVTLATKTSNIIKVVCGKPVLSGKANGKTKVKLSWGKMTSDRYKKVSYEIYRKTKKQKSYKKIKTVSKKSATSFQDKKLKRNTNYMYRIKAFYVNKKKKKVYSPYSDVVSVKTKKK